MTKSIKIGIVGVFVFLLSIALPASTQAVELIRTGESTVSPATLPPQAVSNTFLDIRDARATNMTAEEIAQRQKYVELLKERIIALQKQILSVQKRDAKLQEGQTASPVSQPLNDISVTPVQSVAPVSVPVPPTSQTDVLTHTTSCFVFQNNLRYGDKNTTNGDVNELQTRLTQNGYYIDANEDKQGIFGETTAAAVVKFQAAHGVLTTGFVGPLTRAQLNATSCGNVTPITNIQYNKYIDSVSKDIPVTVRHTKEIKVLYPSGREVLANNAANKDTIATIRWDFPDGKDMNVNIDLVGRSGEIVKNIAQNLSNTSRYLWVADNSIPSGYYKIAVSSADIGPSSMGYSPEYFKLITNDKSVSTTDDTTVDTRKVYPDTGRTYTYKPTIDTSSYTQSEGSLDVSVYSNGEDRAGMWYVFGPGEGNLYESQPGANDTDWTWVMDMKARKGKVIQSIDIMHEGSNQEWSTANSSHFPIVVFKNGKQINHAYSDTFPELTDDTISLTLNGQKDNKSQPGTIAAVYFTDKTYLKAKINNYVK